MGFSCVCRLAVEVRGQTLSPTSETMKLLFQQQNPSQLDFVYLLTRRVHHIIYNDMDAGALQFALTFYVKPYVECPWQMRLCGWGFRNGPRNVFKIHPHTHNANKLVSKHTNAASIIMTYIINTSNFNFYFSNCKIFIFYFFIFLLWQIQ